MQWLKVSTAVSKIVGPIVDASGVEYASAVIGDLSLSKNGGTLTALASAATLTYIANGYYTLALTTGNTDTLGSAEISCNKSGYQMPPREFMVLPATVYDALVTNATNATGGLLAATGPVSGAAGYLGASGAQINGTNVNTLAGHDPGATLGTSTLTQAQVTGGAYTIQSSSCVLGDARVANLDAAVSSRSTYSGADTSGTTTLLSRIVGTLAAGTHNPQSGDTYAIVNSGTYGNSALKTALDGAITSIGTILSDVTTILGAVDTEVALLVSRIDVTLSTRAVAGDAMTLTSGERTAIANEVEAQIIDDTDSERVLQAIVDKIAAANPSLDDLTLSAIASAVRTELATELARIDAAISTRATPAQVNSEADTALADVGLTTIVTARVDASVSSRLASVGYTAPDNSGISAIKSKTDNLPASPAAVGDIPAAATNASAVRTELATELARMDAAISSRLASVDYTAPLTASQTRDAVGLAAANLDSQLGDLPTNAELTDALGDITIADVTVGELSAGALNQLSALKRINAHGAVVQNGLIQEIVIGDDYLTADGRQLQFTNTAGSWPDLTGATISLTLLDKTGNAANVVFTGSVHTPSGAGQRVDVELPYDTTASLTINHKVYRLDATLDGGSLVRLEDGLATVVE